MTELELTLIRKWVPIYGYTETAKALHRDVSGVSRHARRMGLQSPLSPQRYHRDRQIGRQQPTGDLDVLGGPGDAEALYGTLEARCAGEEVTT
jgi:hypothetical protein